MDKNWEKFTETGAVSDYIAYTKFRQNGDENADDAKRSGASRKKRRRER